MRWGKNIARISLVIGALALLAPVSSSVSNAAFRPPADQYSTGAQWVQIPPLGHPQLQSSWSLLAKAPLLPSGPTYAGNTLCTSLSDTRCVTNGRNVKLNDVGRWDSNGTFGYVWIAVFPQCTSAEQLNCVANLTATHSDKQVTTNYSRDFSTGNPFTGDPSLKIPNGGLAPVYTINGIPTSTDPTKTESQDFVVRVAAYGQNRIAACSSAQDKASEWCKNKDNPKWEEGSEYPQARIEGFRVDVMRAKPYTGTITPLTPKEYVELEVDKNIRFTVTTRVADYAAPRGWMSGRLDNPTFSQTAVNGGYELTIGGSPTQVPTPDGQLTCSQYAQLSSPETALARADFESAWQGSLQSAGLPSAPVCDANAVQRLIAASNNAQNFSYNYSSRLFRTLTPHSALIARSDEQLQNEISWLVALGDKASSVESQWLIGWAPPLPGAEANASPCTASGLTGIVSTNASMYGQMPIFDPQTGALEYAMAGPHYLADGVTLNKGAYSLIVSRDYVLCEWGVDPADTTMAVTVRYDTGLQQDPPTTTTSYDGQFLTLTATGFTFSAPKVNVKPVEKKIKKKRTVRAKARSKVSITKIVPQKKRTTTSWYVLKGKCKIDKATPQVLTMPKKGTCQVAVTQFNLRSKKSTRTLLTLRT